LLLQQKRERFLNFHNSDTPPPYQPAQQPRRMHFDMALLFIWASLMLLCGLYFFGKTVIPALHSIGTRERETRAWVQKLTVKPSVGERDNRNQQLAKELIDLETESGRELRWTMALAAILFAPMLIGFPLLLIWLLLQTYYLLRSGTIVRGKLVSRRSWNTSARLSFITADGRQVETVPIQRVPIYAPAGTKLWVLYSPRRPKYVLVYRPDGKLPKLL
jgi:hypothetical protein